MHQPHALRLLLLALFLAALVAALAFDLGYYLSLESIKAQQEAIRGYQTDHPLTVAIIVFIAYVIIAALSLPGAAVMTLLAGALFGFWWGVAIVSFASTLGATLAFLLTRFLLRDWVQRRYHTQLATLNEGFKKEGGFYLFALRLLPIVPFFLVNILASLMPIRTWSFYLISQLGMLPGTAVYVYAGRELGNINSLADIVSPSLIAALVLLGIFPLIAKRVLAVLRRRRNRGSV